MTILAWHFAAKTLRDGRPVPIDGELLRHEGELVLCERGLHASRRILDALSYAPGNTLCRVKIGGKIIMDVDKIVASERTIIWRIDARDVLQRFARCQALGVAHLWRMPAVVRSFLETGEESLRRVAHAADRRRRHRRRLRPRRLRRTPPTPTPPPPPTPTPTPPTPPPTPPPPPPTTPPPTTPPTPTPPPTPPPTPTPTPAPTPTPTPTPPTPPTPPYPERKQTVSTNGYGRTKTKIQSPKALKRMQTKRQAAIIVCLISLFSSSWLHPLL